MSQSRDKASREVRLTIDGREIMAREGENLVKVADEHGVFIPSLCYFEHIEPCLGTCRVCTCEVDGHAKPACMTRVRHGMDVTVNSEELLDVRRAIVEMMFAEGNHFCASCEKSGNCDLQHMGYEMDISKTRFPHLFKDRIIDFEPKRMVIEHNRCVKCQRCVHEVHTDDGKSVFSFVNRGNETVVGVDYEQEARLSHQQAVDAMNLCPTGAILVRGESAALPFGDRQFDNETSRPDAEVLATKQAPSKRDPKVIATISLAGCFGCHMSLLDVDLGIIDLVEFIEFNKSPLNDIKEFTKQCDIGLIEGGCCNSENVEVLREFRKKCDILVAVGECSVWGGLPAMRNSIPLHECLEEAYLNSMTTTNGDIVVPYHEDLPKILDKVYACNEIVEIDHFIPGCPPSADHIWKAVQNILWGDQYSVLYSEFKYD